MNLEEAIKTAIIYEMKVRDVYDKAAQNAVSPTGQKVFQVMAKEEQYHVNYLQEQLEEWQSKGLLKEMELKTFVPSKKTIQDNVQKLTEKVGEKPGGEELQSLQKALEVEKETSNFYRDVVGKLSGEGQKMFERFLEIEEGHLAIVQAELDSVSGSGFWFDSPEFSLELF